MRKAKKTKVPQRRSALDRIAAKLRTALCRETTNIIEIGNLLIESRKHLDHGEWLPWLEKNFDLSPRSAQRYIASAEYVAGKSDTVAHFTSLAPTVLYWLAAGQYYSEKEEAAILAATRERRVDEDAADAICKKLAPPGDDVVDDADDQDDDGGDDTEAATAEDPEIAAILDGPPPPVPPPAPPPPPTDYALRDFDQAIGVLKRLTTKPSAQFVGSTHSADDLEVVEDFLHAVTKAKAVPEAAS